MTRGQEPVATRFTVRGYSVISTGKGIDKRMGKMTSIVLAQARGIYAFRGFIMGSVKREFSLRYSNSMLGAAWLILQPLSQILIFTLVFSQVLGSRLAGVPGTFSYSIFLCAGVLTWGFFSEIITRSQTVFLDYANLIKKINFPRICLPVVVILNALTGFAIVFGLFTLFLVITGNFPGWKYAAIFPVLGIQIMFAIGLGIIIGILHVFFRDVGQFFTIVMQLWFWLTPIVYPLSTLPDWAAKLVRLNPIAPIAKAYQRVLVYGTAPVWGELAPSFIIAVIFCIFAVLLFLRRAGEIVDEL